MADFEVRVELIDENAHPCVFAGWGHVEGESAIALGAAMVGAGVRALILRGCKMKPIKFFQTVDWWYHVGRDSLVRRQPEDQWKERTPRVV